MCIPCLKARIEYIKLAFIRALCWDTHALELVLGLFCIITGIHLIVYPNTFSNIIHVIGGSNYYRSFNLFWAPIYIISGIISLFVTIFLSSFIRRLMSLVMLFLWLSATYFLYYAGLTYYISFFTYALLSLVSIFTHLAPWRYKWR